MPQVAPVAIAAFHRLPGNDSPSITASARTGTTAAALCIVTPHRPSSTSPTTPTAELAGLATMVDDVVLRLDGSAFGAPLSDVVAECNAALELCLETQRASRVRESSVTARDELRRLARLLTVVEAPDAAIVLRQIRRVLGRLTHCGA
jgi:hypothetical protein